MADKPPAKQIDDIIANLPDWRGARLAELRQIILRANPALVEAVKWKKPSRPEGVAVWMRDGNICVADVLKSAVRLTFPSLPDPNGLFNARLASTSARAIDFTEHDAVDDMGLAALIVEAAKE
jgi:hypothetical protein